MLEADSFNRVQARTKPLSQALVDTGKHQVSWEARGLVVGAVSDSPCPRTMQRVRTLEVSNRLKEPVSGVSGPKCH